VDTDTKPLERPDLSVRVTVREDPAVLARLEQRAFSAGRSLSDEVRAALRDHLQRRK
jgi:plasmid stability protein